MKKIIISLLGAALIVACSKENFETNSPILSEEQEITSEEDRGLSDFAIILSRAINQEPELRAFIKKEALKEFDKDYDVFYPFVKDTKVDGDKTFRDILVEYDDNQILPSIEEALPLLDILVPDWSWIAEDTFCAERWELDNEDVCISIRTNKQRSPLYYNGENVCDIEAGFIPGFPVLIIKENERLNVKKLETKSGCSLSYSFIDEAFDGIKHPKTRGTSYLNITKELDYEPATNFIDKSLVPEKVMQAYNLSKTRYFLPQRDYIYYGIVNENDEGKLDHHFTEKILKMKFKQADIPGFYDDIERPVINKEHYNDIAFIEYQFDGNHKNGWNKDELMNKIWGEGKLELEVDILAGGWSTSRGVTVSFKDAFSVKSVHEVVALNTFKAVKYHHYSITEDDLEPKWFNADMELMNWDLASFPTRYKLKVIEHDRGSQITETWSESFDHTNNVSLSAEGQNETEADSSKVSIKFGAGISIKNGSSTKHEMKYLWTQNDDNLHDTYVEFSSPIILKEEGDKVEINIPSTGFVEFMILPIYK